MDKDPAPKTDVFVALMYFAVAATIGGIVLLMLAMGRYGWALPR